jgi:hypothetical protein
VSVQAPILSRPVLAAALTFGGLVALFAVCTPLVPGVEPVEFFGVGVAYSAFLSLFAVGLMLASRRAFRGWILSGMIPLIGTVGFWLWLVLGPDQGSLFRLLPWVSGGLLGLLAAFLLAGLVLAGSGWVRRGRPPG